MKKLIILAIVACVGLLFSNVALAKDPKAHPRGLPVKIVNPLPIPVTGGVNATVSGEVTVVNFPEVITVDNFPDTLTVESFPDTMQVKDVDHPANQPYQYSNWDSVEVNHNNTVLATGESSEEVPEGKRLVVQHISFRISSEAWIDPPMCNARVLNGSSEVVSHPLEMTVSTYGDSTLAIVSMPIVMYADPGMEVGVSCWLKVDAGFVNERFAVTGYFVDLE